ncbi:MAG TPA: SH3 domain-containing protein [Myxococcales bacterium]|nr:SH3 domain-containing protein [Myxococcales bacterium]
MKTLTIVALLLGTACATTSAATGPGAVACEKGHAAIVNQGSTIYVSPDSTSSAITQLSKDARMCVASEQSGFGFRKVRLPDGRTGYVSESNLML